MQCLHVASQLKRSNDPEVSSNWTEWRIDGELTVPPWLSGSSAAANQCWLHSGCPGRSRWRPRPRWRHAHVIGSDLREDRRRTETSPPAILICCVCLSGQCGLTLNGSDFPLIFIFTMIIVWIFSQQTMQQYPGRILPQPGMMYEYANLFRRKN